MPKFPHLIILLAIKECMYGRSSQVSSPKRIEEYFNIVIQSEYMLKKKKKTSDFFFGGGN